ncbi:MAG: hypothetical protein MJZ05_07775 [Fibrobacter sp.]|nr:hypothetical protein [Fibrobacter sp.]
MKNFKLLFSVAVAAALFGCSSMEISDEEAYNENLPADFSCAEYMAIHPALRNLQIKDYVKEQNDAFETASGDAFKELKSADSAAFDANAETLKSLYLDPYIGGYTEEEWTSDMSDGERDSLIFNTVDHPLTRTVVDSSATPVAIYKLTIGTWDISTKSYTAIGAIEVDAEGVVTKVSGNDENDVLKEFDIGGKISINRQGTKDRKDTVSVDTVKVPTKGGIPVDKMKKLRSFNLFGTTEDLAALQAVPLDTFAISYQFVLFGKLHGWAYRPCTESEAAKDPVVPEYPATALYCDDNGKTKEID